MNAVTPKLLPFDGDTYGRPAPPKPCWHLAVVGSAEGWERRDLVVRLDAAVACILGRYQPIMVGLTNGPAFASAPRLRLRVRADAGAVAGARP